MRPRTPFRIAAAFALSSFVLAPVTALAQGPAQAAEAGMMMLFGVLIKTPSARAHTPGSAPGGPYENLSGQNQKVARALYAAQKPESATFKRLTLDQIAEQKKSQDWNGVFQAMRSEGRVQAPTLASLLTKQESERPR